MASDEAFFHWIMDFSPNFDGNQLLPVSRHWHCRFFICPYRFHVLFCPKKSSSITISAKSMRHLRGKTLFWVILNLVFYAKQFLMRLLCPHWFLLKNGSVGKFREFFTLILVAPCPKNIKQFVRRCTYYIINFPILIYSHTLHLIFFIYQQNSNWYSS